MKTETEVEQCYKKIHEGKTSKERRSTRPENVEIENSMRRLQIGKRPKKKRVGRETNYNGKSTHLLGRPVSAIRDVVPDGAGEQRRLLTHHRYLTAEPVRV